MSYEEKSSWVLVVLAVLSLGVYLTITLVQASGAPITEIPYATTMLWTIVGSIVVSIVIHIFLGLFSRDRQKDQRDREFSHFGERVGNGLLVAGALSALVLAWLEVDWFWIANALYLGFALSGVLASVAKIVAYRKGIVGAW